MYLYEMERQSVKQNPALERTALLFRRPAELKATQTAVAQVLRAVTSDAPVNHKLMVLARDPVLLLRFARTHGIHKSRDGARSLDILAALNRSSISELRSFVTQTVSGGYVGMNAPTNLIDQERMNLHGFFVGLAAFAYVGHSTTTELNASEMMAFGATHDVPIVALAKMQPDMYLNVCQFAIKCATNFATAFQCIHPTSLHAMAGNAVVSWRLEESLASAWKAFDDNSVLEFDEVRYVLRVADWMATELGFDWEPWRPPTTLPDPIKKWYESTQDVWEQAAMTTLALCKPLATGLAA